MNHHGNLNRQRSMESIKVFKSQTKQRHRRVCKDCSFLELTVIEMFRNRAMAKVAPLRVQKNFFSLFVKNRVKTRRSKVKNSWLPQIQGQSDFLMLKIVPVKRSIFEFLTIFLIWYCKELSRSPSSGLKVTAESQENSTVNGGG